MLKTRRGEIATLLTLSLVLIGGLITLGTSLFVNNQKANFASNSRAAVCPEVYECLSINPPVCKKKNFDVSCQFTNYTDADISKCAGKPCNRTGVGLTATPIATPKLTSMPTPRQLSTPILSSTATPKPIITAPTFPPQIQPTQTVSCVFSPSKTCPAGTTKVSASGFCGCVVNQTAITKRCVAQNNLPIINHPARVEEFKSGRWQIIEECVYPKTVCDSNTFICVSSPPNPNGKDFGSGCSTGNECKSGNCDSTYTEPWGETIYLFSKKCVYSIAEQTKFVEKKGDRDVQTTGALLTAAAISSPIIRSTYKVVTTSGLSTATYYLFQQLQQPWVQKSAAAINVASTIYALSDCVKNGANGEWCNMLAAVASGNPGQFGLALGNDLSTLKTSAIEIFRLTKMPSIIKNSGVDESLIWTNKIIDPPTVEPVTIDPEPLMIRNPVVANKPPDPGNFPIGFKFRSNRGGTVFVDEEIGSGGFGTVYRATLYEAGVSPKSVVVKFPKSVTPSGMIALQNEQFILADGQNALPSRLRANLAKPYGFVSNGSTELPVSENFGPGNTLSRLIKQNFPKPTVLSRAAVNDLLETARILDGSDILLRDVFPSNIFVRRDGTLVLYDPFFPRLNPDTGKVTTFIAHRFDLATVDSFGLDIRLLTRDGSKWQYYVPIKSEVAINKMLQLYNGLIVVK